MKRIFQKKGGLLILFALLIVRFEAKAQESSVGFAIGTAHSLTDLGGLPAIGQPFIMDMNLRATRPSASLHYKYSFNPYFGLRVNLLWAMLNGDDKYTFGTPPPNPSASWYRSVRNLNFNTHILQLSLAGEVNLKKYSAFATSNEKERWAPYIGIGGGAFFFNPYTYYYGSRVFLRNLGTEGQNIIGKKYSLISFNLLAYAGFKFNINSRIAIFLEGAYHHTFTDYLDDVSTKYPDLAVYNQLSPLAQALSNRNNEQGAPYPDAAYNFIVRDKNGIGQQRGDSKDKDHFITIQIGLSIRVGKQQHKNTPQADCYKKW